MIEVTKLSKHFSVHKKSPGLLASIKSLVHREKIVKRAVESVSLHVGEGEILGLVGANGAGKTTLVKMLAGIIHPTSGDARVLGHRPWERKNDFRRQIALIMGQKAQLWWDLPAADCFLLLKEIYQIPDKLYHDSLNFLLDALDVKSEVNIQIRRLSLGERMKMELIAALLHSPKAVFLDEPTIGLDLSAQRAIRDFLLEYRREHKPAMILTSHYMEDIERLCKRIIIIRNGEFVFDGKLQEVLTTFAKHKILTAHLGRDTARPDISALLAPLECESEVLEYTKNVLKVKIPRDIVSQSAGLLLQNLTVKDLSIEETDIASVIENLLGKSKADDELNAIKSASTKTENKVIADPAGEIS
jgi:ABC-2 type transport system ATP-binding protein